jgi:hypothetical protein
LRSERDRDRDEGAAGEPDQAAPVRPGAPDAIVEDVERLDRAGEPADEDVDLDG